MKNRELKKPFLNAEKYLERLCPDAVLYRSLDVIAVNKPSGVPVIPERIQSERPCFRQIVETYLQQKIFVVHRLDKETSGVTLFALNKKSHRALCFQFEQGLVEKVYVAIVHGYPKFSQWVCDLPICQGRKGKMRIGGNKKSVTEFRVLARLEGEKTLILARPKTGRTHQVRLHLAASGHAVLGDKKYFATARVIAGVITERLAYSSEALCLHALAISFEDPGSARRVRVEAPMPAWLDSGLHNLVRQAICATK